MMNIVNMKLEFLIILVRSHDMMRKVIEGIESGIKVEF